MEKVGILYICTGKYVTFWEEFFESAEKNLLTECEKHYFVFTDAGKVFGEDRCNRIHHIYQKNLGWPGNTLYRYHIFCKNADAFRMMDYVFFFNANVIVNERVLEDDFLPVNEGLMFVQHPLFYDKPNYEYTYERRRRSTAYIPFGKGTIYICGGCNGGKTADFLKMAHSIADNVDNDDKKKIVAAWHDESHINRYLLECQNKNVPYKLLDPGYCYPDEFDFPFHKILGYRKKERYFNVVEMKERKLSFRERVSNLIILARKNKYVMIHNCILKKTK